MDSTVWPQSPVYRLNNAFGDVPCPLKYLFCIGSAILGIAESDFEAYPPIKVELVSGEGSMRSPQFQLQASSKSLKTIGVFASKHTIY